eukprot:5920668-Amphidinium_carterae.1
MSRFRSARKNQMNNAFASRKCRRQVCGSQDREKCVSLQYEADVDHQESFARQRLTLRSPKPVKTPKTPNG